MSEIMNAIKLYRLSNRLYKIKFRVLATIVQKFNSLIHNSYIPCSAKIGYDCNFAYGGIGVVIHCNAKIGNNCMIGQNITIGGRAGHGGPPVIGNNVYIAAGSRVLGQIKIGDNVVIGANAVVIKDIPSNSVVAGVPAKIISQDVSKFKKLGVI